MSYRLNGTDPFWRASIGAFNGYAFRNSALSGATLFKRLSTGSWHGLHAIDNGSTGNYSYMYEFNPSDQIAADMTTANPFSSTATFADSTNWIIMGFTWTGGTSAGNWVWRYKIGAGAWSSENETNPGSNATTAGSGYRHLIGNEAGLLDDTNTDFCCVGLIKSNLSQASFESLNMTAFTSWQSVFTGAGAALWGFETIASQTDRAGNGANESSRSGGITLVSDPPGWSWGAAAAAKVPTQRWSRRRSGLIAPAGFGR
jgi:hypothetical protein